jgi:cytoskeleton protein RodZ
MPDYELTPGALLRRSRQRYGWSVEDVADELKLLPYVVEAIEQDDYSQMAGWTYAVGYLRGYAKLVGVNIELAITEHASLLPQKEDGPGTLTYRTAAKVSIPIPLSWVMTAVVVIVVIGGISATYWKRANDADRVVLETAAPEESTPARILPQLTPETPAAAELIGIKSSSIQPDPSVKESSEPISEATQSVKEGEDAERTESDTNYDSSETAELVVRPLTLGDMDTRIIGSLSVAVIGNEGVTTMSPEESKMPSQSKLGADTSEISGGTGPRELMLFFDQGSWADVRDARGRQLLRESVRAGATVRLEGDPPFTVFVGNARGVRYLYRGEEKTAPAFGESLFGRFQVGLSE